MHDTARTARLCSHFDTQSVLRLTDTPVRQAYGQDMHTQPEGGTMRHKNRFSFVALGLAVAAIAAPSAQARPDPEPTGPELRALHQAILAKSVRATGAKVSQRVSLPRRPIREYEPGESG